MNKVDNRLEGDQPSFSQTVYDALPDTLKASILDEFSYREKDVFLMGLISTLSGCLLNIKGNYLGSTVYPNFNFMVVAPPSSGKGVLKHVRTCVSNIDKFFKHAAVKEHNLPMKRLLIPGDSSAAAVLQTLDDNDGCGIILETEIDTLTNSLTQDWGQQFSTVIRKSFHHEQVSCMRKDSPIIEIENPKLSIVLSGTPNQYFKLIPSAKDGSFSRFINYTFTAIPEWKNLGNYDSACSLDEYYSGYAKTIFSLFQFYYSRDVNFKLSKDHVESFNEVFIDFHDSIYYSQGDEAISYVRRHGLIFYRICMVLTAIRYFEIDNKEDQIICNDDDFANTVRIIQVLLRHSQFLYSSFTRDSSFSSPQAKVFYDSVDPNQEFSTKSLVDLGISLGNGERSIKKWLSHFTGEGLLSKTKYGYYMKPG